MRDVPHGARPRVSATVEPTLGVPRVLEEENHEEKFLPAHRPLLDGVRVARACLSTPGELFADNNAYSFQGQYTAPGCGPAFDFTIGAGTRTIDVVASTIPANDIVLKLYHNGALIAQQDTGTSPEPIHYATGADLETGKYSVVVCPFNGEAASRPRITPESSPCPSCHFRRSRSSRPARPRTRRRSIPSRTSRPGTRSSLRRRSWIRSGPRASRW